MASTRRAFLGSAAAFVAASGNAQADIDHPSRHRSGGVGFEDALSPVIDTIPYLLPPPSRPLSMVLCLCMDMSQSIRKGERDPLDEVRLQIDGTADALSSPGVVAAIRDSVGGIGILCTQFSDFGRQSVGFAVLRDAEETHHYAELIRRSRVMVPAGGTGITRGLCFSGAKILQAQTRLGYDFRRRVIDISGDGRQGPDPWHVNLPGALRELATLHGITVNGLAIQSHGDPRDILAYYRAQVDTPPGYIHRRRGRRWSDPVLPGRSWKALSREDFVFTMERKLQYEIAGGTQRRIRG